MEMIAERKRPYNEMESRHLCACMDLRVCVGGWEGGCECLTRKFAAFTQAPHCAKAVWKIKFVSWRK